MVIAVWRKPIQISCINYILQMIHYKVIFGVCVVICELVSAIKRARRVMV